MDFFLTAYDPSDLPGSSIDPLGFERGYLFLADKILPGMTNVAARPRYFGLICAGIFLNRDDEQLSVSERIRSKREILLRLERFWALANVLAAENGDAEGIRGLRYAQAKARELSRSQVARVDARYPLLSRQVQYGAIGMYAAVADGMRYLNRESFTLTADLGEVAGEGFLKETELPSSLKAAVLADSDVNIATLRNWGERAHIQAEVGPVESKCLFDALHSNSVRSRMAAVLKRNPFQNGESELARIARVARVLKDKPEDADLAEALVCILAYEECYRLAQLSLERLLWLCRRPECAATVSLQDLATDPVIKHVRVELPAAAVRFVKSLDSANTEAFRQNLDSLQDIRMFLQLAAAKAEDSRAFVLEVIKRHSDVQRGKFDRGRPKMPWLETNEGKVFLTMTRIGGVNFETSKPEQLAPHPYRLRAADAMIAAAAKGAPR